jgi:prepilin-type N-terminal cleavage/methylation domain-containing protein
MIHSVTKNNMHRYAIRQRGFTLIEVVLTIIIMGILVATTMRALKPVAETARIEQTKHEMDELQTAILGDAVLENNGTRSDFGYVGDVGSLPPNLTALASNPSGYATWRGPYIKTGFAGASNDYLADAWGANYVYAGGVNITSVGSGSSIIKKLSNSVGDLLFNRVTGVVTDNAGVPPGPVYRDSINVSLVIPDGAGALTTRTLNPDAGGYFAFDSIPVGNHDIHLVFLPTNDTLSRFVSVIPQSSVDGHYYVLDADYFSSGGTGGGIELVTGSDSLSTPQCFRLTFLIRNDQTVPVTIYWVKLTWSSPEAYYRTLDWNSTRVADGWGLGSGDVVSFYTPMTIAAGETVGIAVGQFKNNPSGTGPPVDMTGADISVEFSDGSTFDMTAVLCYP